MSTDLPYLTRDFPGIRGTLKQRPEEALHVWLALSRQQSDVTSQPGRIGDAVGFGAAGYQRRRVTAVHPARLIHW